MLVGLYYIYDVICSKQINIINSSPQLSVWTPWESNSCYVLLRIWHWVYLFEFREKSPSWIYILSCVQLSCCFVISKHKIPKVKNKRKKCLKTQMKLYACKEPAYVRQTEDELQIGEGVFSKHWTPHISLDIQTELLGSARAEAGSARVQLGPQNKLTELGSVYWTATSSGWARLGSVQLIWLAYFFLTN